MKRNKNGQFVKGIVPWNKGKGKPKILTGRDTKFKKGQTAWNKGLKGYLAGKQHYNYIDGRSYSATPARYGDDWDKIRLLIYRRDNYRCQHCGVKGERLDVHHKIPFLISFDNSLGNLIALCRSCHAKEERRIMKELQEVSLCR